MIGKGWSLKEDWLSRGRSYVDVAGLLPVAQWENQNHIITRH